MPSRPSASTAPSFAAIDFGTSNSAIATPDAGGGMSLVELEPGFFTAPTAVFYRADVSEHGPEPWRWYGRAAVAAYVDGLDGRLMRSMKSILGSTLVEQRTDVGGGRAVSYIDIISGYLRHLKTTAEKRSGKTLTHVVMGRPVFFVDGDPARDAQAQAALESAARAVGFREVHFQFEPIAAALDHEQTVQAEQLVLVSDIGGGTSDFSLVRVGPKRGQRLQRKDDILASHGVHLAGTDFDRHIELMSLMPHLGYRTLGPAKPGEAAREVPSSVYFDLSTWHLINTVYSPARLADVRSLRSWYAEPRHHARLMTVVEERLGHALAATAEQAKIDVATRGEALIDLGLIEAGLATRLVERDAAASIEPDVARIVTAAAETARMAGVKADAVDALYFTGGSTGFAPLVNRIAACFPRAQVLRGDRFASVASGLGVYARVLYGGKGR
jgi:hypothetical chaperone protein